MSLGQCFSKDVNAWVGMRRYGRGPIRWLTCTPDPWEPGRCPFTLCDSGTGIWQCLLKWISGALFIYNQATVPDFPRAKVCLSIIQSFLQSSNTFQASIFYQLNPQSSFHGGLVVKNPPAMQEMWVGSLGWEDPREKGTVYPLQYSGLENSMDCTVTWDGKESDTTEGLSLSKF